MRLFFVKIFIRNLSRKGLFPVINIAGLSIGLAAVLLIYAFIFNEYSKPVENFYYSIIQLFSHVLSS